MIPDCNTNYVYFSDILRTDPEYSESCKRITEILDKHKVRFSFLQQTKDIWARDYMPVQISKDSFIQFRYEPSYLIDDLDLQSDPKEVCLANGIIATFSDINLDGGNVVKWEDKVIITDRIFIENEGNARNKLISQLEIELQVPVIVIPALKPAWDMTGHADGYVRFINSDTILVNDPEKEFKYWRDGFKKAVRENGLKYEVMPWFEYKDKNNPSYSAIGIYLNYLEIGDLIIFPVFNIKGNRDQEALDLIREYFPGKKIEPIEINKIAREGGLMNCISWNIKK